MDSQILSNVLTDSNEIPAPSSIDTAESATKSVVEHKGSAGRCWGFRGYLTELSVRCLYGAEQGIVRQMPGTEKRSRGAHDCRVLLASAARRNETALLPGGYRVTLTRVSVRLIPNTKVLESVRESGVEKRRRLSG